MMTVDNMVDQRTIIAERTLERVLYVMPRRYPRAIGLEEYEPLPSDIVITTFPKSGTTLTQQLTYQVVVATGGASSVDPDGLNYSDICAVVPYVDYGSAHGFPPFDSSPRLFKSHAVPSMFKTTIQRHIVVFRDIASYPSSCLDFLFDSTADEDVTDNRIKELVFHKFVQVRLLGVPYKQDDPGFGFPFEKDAVIPKTEKGKLPLGSWFLHAKAWVEALRPGVLVLFYEEMVKDMVTTAHKVARFIGRELSNQGLQTVLERCSREYMAGDEKFMSQLEGKVVDLSGLCKAKPAARDGFKKFKISDDDTRGVNARFQQEFDVPDYIGFVEMVKHKVEQIGQ